MFQKHGTGVGLQLWKMCSVIQGNAVHRTFAEETVGNQAQLWSGLDIHLTSNKLRSFGQHSSLSLGVSADLHIGGAGDVSNV